MAGYSGMKRFLSGACESSNVPFRRQAQLAKSPTLATVILVSTEELARVRATLSGADAERSFPAGSARIKQKVILVTGRTAPFSER